MKKQKPMKKIKRRSILIKRGLKNIGNYLIKLSTFSSLSISQIYFINTIPLMTKNKLTFRLSCSLFLFLITKNTLSNYQYGFTILLHMFVKN